MTDTNSDSDGVPEEVLDELAEQAIGMALDNGSDMLGTNPEQHLADEWHGYAVHTVEDHLLYREEETPAQDYDHDVLVAALYEYMPEKVHDNLPGHITEIADAPDEV
ncbi:MAG: hypothetical protein ACI9CA_000443 [Natronomonas sp.]|jgi:hypothetical protein